MRKIGFRGCSSLFCVFISLNRSFRKQFYLFAPIQISSQKTVPRLKKYWRVMCHLCNHPPLQSYAYTTLYLSRIGSRLNLSHLSVIHRETLLPPRLYFYLVILHKRFCTFFVIMN